MSFDPTSVGLYPRIIVSKSHENTSKYLDTLTIFQTFDQKVDDPNDPQMTFNPISVKSHVQLYPRIIVSNSHKNTSQHVDRVTLFSKTFTKGQWPLDNLWPHFCWGHMCDST